MELPAPLAVAAEIRALDVGARTERVWRVTRAIGAAGVSVARDLPYERGRPVEVILTLPDEKTAIVVVGVVAEVRPNDEAAEGAEARPRAIAFTALDEDARRRIMGYVTERTEP